MVDRRKVCMLSFFVLIDVGFPKCRPYCGPQRPWNLQHGRGEGNERRREGIGSSMHLSCQDVCRMK